MLHEFSHVCSHLLLPLSMFHRGVLVWNPKKPKKETFFRWDVALSYFIIIKINFYTYLCDFFPLFTYRKQQHIVCGRIRCSTISLTHKLTTKLCEKCCLGCYHFRARTLDDELVTHIKAEHFLENYVRRFESLLTQHDRRWMDSEKRVIKKCEKLYGCKKTKQKTRQ